MSDLLKDLFSSPVFGLVLMILMILGGCTDNAGAMDWVSNGRW